MLRLHQLADAAAQIVHGFGVTAHHCVQFAEPSLDGAVVRYELLAIPVFVDRISDVGAPIQPLGVGQADPSGLTSFEPKRPRLRSRVLRISARIATAASQRRSRAIASVASTYAGTAARSPLSAATSWARAILLEL